MKLARVEIERDLKPANITRPEVRVIVTTRAVDDEARLRRVAELINDLLDSPDTPEEGRSP